MQWAQSEANQMNNYVIQPKLVFVVIFDLSDAVSTQRTQEQNNSVILQRRTISQLFVSSPNQKTKDQHAAFNSRNILIYLNFYSFAANNKKVDQKNHLSSTLGSYSSSFSLPLIHLRCIQRIADKFPELECIFHVHNQAPQLLVPRYRG
jgi:hypothetical protein